MSRTARAPDGATADLFARKPAARPRAGTSVFGDQREPVQPAVAVPKGFRLDARNRADGLEFLGKLAADAFPLCVFDPQYRGILDRQAYGNEGARQAGRARMRQMTAAEIKRFVRKIGRALMPSGHLLFWTDKFHLCTGVAPWLGGTALDIVDLVVWDKQRMGMGYRTRRVSEYLVVLQKAPRRAKGVWTLHDIPDVWREKAEGGGPHAKPVGLQARLIEALTNPGDTVVDPAAGSYSVLAACRRAGRHFLGCDIQG